MAVTQHTYTGNGSTTDYAFTFPYLDKTDVQVKLNAATQATTAYSFANATTIRFATAPSSGDTVIIFRNTNNDAKKGTFFAGSAIKAEDLNDNFDQILYVAQEVDNNAMSTLGTAQMQGDIEMGKGMGIVFEGATEDAYETRLAVADPTADRTITLPNVTGTVVTTGDTGTITSTMIQNATIDTATLQTGAVTGVKIANATITDTQLATDSVNAAKIAAAAVGTSELANDSVTNAKIADDQIDSEHYVDGSIDTAHIADAQVTTAKLANSAVTTDKLTATGVTTPKIADNAITTAKITDAHITTAKIAALAVDSAKLASDSVTTAKILNANVTTPKIADANVTEVKLAANSVSEAKIVDNAVTNAKIVNGAVNHDKLTNDSVITAKIADNAVTTAKIADSELKVLAGMQGVTASVLADSTALSATNAEINSICENKASQTTITNDDSKIPTSGAVVDYVEAQLLPFGGFEVVATEILFPNTQPVAGVVISISDAGGVVFNGSGVSTTGRTAGGSTVTINGAPSSLYSETLAAGVGLMVSSTGSSQTYNYHKILGKEDDIKQLSDDINDFNARYRVASSAPGSSNDAGDLYWDTSTNKMKVYNATTSAWDDVAQSSSSHIVTLSEAFDGSRTDFTMSTAATDAQSTIVSINGVIQKPNAGTSTPSEGFAISSNTLKLSNAPASGSDYFVVVLGDTVSIGTPSDNTVDADILQSGCVTTAKIAADAVDGTKIADDAVGAEHIEVLDSHLQLADSCNIKIGTGNDLQLYHDGTRSYINNTTGGLYLESGSTEIGLIKGTYASGEWMVKAVNDGAVELYYDNTKKFETTSGGISISGSVSVDAGSNTTQAIFSGSGGSGARGLAILTEAAGAADEGVIFNARASGTTATMKFQTNGSTALTIQGEGDEIDIPDDTQLRFGNGNDLQILHDGSASIIRHTHASNDLYIQCDNTIYFTDVGANEVFLKIVDDGAVELYHNDGKRFETTADGIQVTGKAFVDRTVTNTTGDHPALEIETLSTGTADDNFATGIDFKAAGTAVGRIAVDKGGDLTYFTDAAGSEVGLKIIDDGAVELYHDNTKRLATNSGGVSFYGDLWANDNDKITLGFSNDLQLFHDGTHSWVRNYTGILYLGNASGSPNDIRLQAKYGEESIVCNDDGSVELYYDNVKTFETTSVGCRIGGNTTASTAGDDLVIEGTSDRGLSIIAGTSSSSNIYLGDTDDTDVGRIAYQHTDNKIQITVGTHTGYTLDSAARIFNSVAAAGQSTNCYEINKNGGGVDTDAAQNIILFQVGGYNRSGIESGSGGSDLGAFYNTSDRRIKTNFRTYTGGWDKIKQIPVKLYDELSNDDTKELIGDKPKTNCLGWIADELQQVFPEAVRGTKDAVDENGKPIFQTVTQARIFPDVVQALQAAMTKIETLETKVAALEAA